MSDRGLRKGDTFLLDSLQPTGCLYLVEVVSNKWRRGGTSVVFQAEADMKGRKHRIALKTLSIQRHGATAQEHLRREVESLRRVRHRFVVPLLGSARVNGRFILASPFMANGNLLEYLRDNHGTRTEVLLQQVACGMRYLHDCAGIVHGDLKCENVLVSAAGDALLTDFGLSTPIDKPVAESETHTGFRALNTLRFAARELLLDTARSDDGRVRSKTPASDVYAYGMLVVQAFTGERPWPGFTDIAVVLNVIASTTINYPRPRRHGVSVLPDVWWAICTACWASDPLLRPAACQVTAVLAVRKDMSAFGENHFN